MKLRKLQIHAVAGPLCLLITAAALTACDSSNDVHPDNQCSIYEQSPPGNWMTVDGSGAADFCASSIQSLGKEGSFWTSQAPADQYPSSCLLVKSGLHAEVSDSSMCAALAGDGWTGDTSGGGSDNGAYPDKLPSASASTVCILAACWTGSS